LDWLSRRDAKLSVFRPYCSASWVAQVTSPVASYHASATSPAAALFGLESVLMERGEIVADHCEHCGTTGCAVCGRAA